eukprot:TRINITY_DN15103_c0_g1_i1.p1 TRINITY_DN15103_c0_g1~~TRINITY_DN15103_c0_g1_i1.p1  ORF type:complete len:120 (+),score=8.82 TRINITY_DN15103_c0_g1_i1:212-571(+)
MAGRRHAIFSSTHPYPVPLRRTHGQKPQESRAVPASEVDSIVTSHAYNSNAGKGQSDGRSGKSLMPSSLVSLPRDALAEICWRLPPADLLRLESTCKGVKAVTDSEEVWGRVCERLWGV